MPGAGIGFDPTEGGITAPPPSPLGNPQAQATAFWQALKASPSAPAAPAQTQAGMLGGSAPPTDPQAAAFWKALGTTPTGAGGQPAAKQSGGGGIGGFLSGALHGVEKIGSRASAMALGLPQGFASLAQDIGKVGYRAGENIINDVTLGSTHFGPRSGWADSGPAIAPQAQVAADLRQNYPTLEAARAGFAQTGKEVIHPSQILTNYSRDPLGAGLNDALTIATIVDPAAETLKAAGLGETVAGRALSGVAEAGKAVAGAPLKPYEFAGKTLGAPLIGRLGDLQVGGQSLADRVGTLRQAADLRRQYGEFYQSNVAQPGLQARGDLARPFTEIAKIVPDHTEQAAVQAILRNETGLLGPTLQRAADEGRLTPAEHAQILSSVAGAGGTIPPDALRLAEAFRAGSLPAEQMARLGQAVDLQRTAVLDPRQATELAGTNRLPNLPPMNPEQLGTAPLSRGVAEATAPFEARLAGATRLAEGTRAAADKAAAAVREEPVRLGRGPTSRLEQAVGPAERAVQAAEKAGALGGSRLSDIAARAQEAQLPQNPPLTSVEQTAPGLNERLGMGVERTPATPEQRQAAVEAFHQAADATTRKVADALGTDASAGRRGEGYGGLSPEEQAVYRQQQAEQRSGTMTDRLGAARQALIDRTVEKARVAGQAEGARLGEAARTERVASKAAFRASKAAQDLTAARAKAEEALQNTPARLRPMRSRATAGVDALTAAAEEAHTAGDLATAARLAQVAGEIPTTLASIRDAGINAEHLIGQTGEQRAALSKLPQGPRLAVGSKAGAAIQRSAENLATAPDIKGQYRIEVARSLQGVDNRAAMATDRQFGDTAGNVAPAGGRGKALDAQVRQAGYTPWQPGRGWTRGVVPADQVTAATRVLPTLLLDEFGKREAPLRGGKIGAAFDHIQRALYKDPLMLSPTFQARRLVGDLFMAHTRGDMSPLDIIRTAPRAIAEMRAQGDLARGVSRSGLFENERVALQEARVGRTGPAGALGRARDVSMRATNFVDNASKVMVALNEIGKGASRDDAVRAGIKALGDYNNSTPFERNVISRWFPVYPWAKEVTKAVFTYADNHPLRTLWLMHLGDLAAQKDANRPGWLKGAIDLGGGRFLPTQVLSPTNILTAPPGGLLNPVIRDAAEIGTGFNPSKWAMLTRPPVGPQKGTVTGPEALYLAAKNNPLARLYLNQTLQPQLRYDTGEPRFVRGAPMLYNDSQSLANRVAGMFGVGVSKATLPAPGTLKPPTAATRRATAAGAKYTRQLARYGTGGLP